MTYIGFVYLSTGFLFEKEIPRLIILYVWIFSTLYSIIIRLTLVSIMNHLYEHGVLRKKRILILSSTEETPYTFSSHPSIEYLSLRATESEEIFALIREKKIDSILSILGKNETKKTLEIIKLCEIYGISYAYPKILPHVYELPKHDTFIG